MPKSLWPLVLKGLLGFVIGLAVWRGLSVPYARLLASMSEPFIRLTERPPITSITAEGTLLMVDRSDHPPSGSAGRFGVESTEITFNVILLMTLFAASGRALSDRNVFGFLGAIVSLFFIHLFAVISFVKAYYALSFGAWSELHYGYLARSFWAAAPYFYGVVGVHGAAFALWWLFRPPSTSPVQEGSHPRGLHHRRVRSR